MVRAMMRIALARWDEVFEATLMVARNQSKQRPDSMVMLFCFSLAMRVAACAYVFVLVLDRARPVVHLALANVRLDQFFVLEIRIRCVLNFNSRGQ